MPTLELPHTAGCVVCGADNPHGLHLTSHVDTATGIVRTTFTPGSQHIGFDGIVHGGILGTVADELMVWAAIWHARRACLAAEFTTRFRHKADVGVPLMVTARVTRARGKLVETEADLTDPTGRPVATATGKYLAGSDAETAGFWATLIVAEQTAAAIRHLRVTL